MNFSKVSPLIVLLMSLCGLGHLHAQVEANIQQGTTEVIEINWDIAQENQWLERYSPRLEAFPLSTDIISKDETRLTIQFGKTAEYAFSFKSLSGLHEILISDPDSNKKLHRLRNTDQKTEWISPFIAGQNFTIESNNTDFIIDRIFVRINRLSGSKDLGFDGSLECETNVACSEGNPWSDQAKSVVRMRMVMEEGIGWCTGSLMNNTARDGKPFVLSAFHCQYDFTPRYDEWRFDFNYQSNSCANPDVEPEYQSLTGCTLRASGSNSDYLLVELLDTIPVQYDVYFNGWNRKDAYEPDSVAIIHHPSADIKKVSIDYEEAYIFPLDLHWIEGYDTPREHHYRTYFDVGIHEGGSSGAPLFDLQGRVIGQLHGGRADCTDNFGYSGRLYKSWEGSDDDFGRLSTWLDPMNTAQDTLSGMFHPALKNTYELKGRIVDAKGRALNDVLVIVEGEMDLELFTDSLGQFELPIVGRSSDITIKARKNTAVTNGVTPIDMVMIQKHLLNISPFSDTTQFLAADVSGNSSITGSDLVLIQRLLLGINSGFPGRQSWTFYPSALNLKNIEEDEVVIEIIAVKLGDVNATADPNK